MSIKRKKNVSKSISIDVNITKDKHLIIHHHHIEWTSIFFFQLLSIESILITEFRFLIAMQNDVDAI